MNLLIDSHAHLTDEAFAPDLPEVLDRAAFAGIDRIITVADCLDDAERAAALAHRHDMLAATAGVHPHRSQDWTDRSAARLMELVETGRFVAIGEIGLDYYYDFSPRDCQRHAFVQQLRLAKNFRRPVVIHCRQAEDDLVEILEAESPLPAGGVIHCFCGNAAQARRLIELGFHISIGGMATFRKNHELRKIASEVIPLDRLLLETDSPYLAPEPKRGHRNEPEFVSHVAEVIARCRSISPAEVAGRTRRNALQLFGLGPDISSSSLAYALGNSLYLNLTNRCTNNCVFCARTASCQICCYDLRLPREPSAAEIIAAIGERATDYDEIVFCGYGEPTFRLETLLRVGRWLRAGGVGRVRLNTNGQGNAIHGRSIVADLAAVVDAVWVSLNSSDPEQYAALCQPVDPRFSHEEVCRFIAEAKAKIGEVVATAVAYPGVDVEACRALAEQRLGVRFHCRPLGGRR